MRIISGQFKGRPINPPKNLPVRPTTDFAKEALFNILANRVDMEELVVLDLFSGTGSIAYEFISRGCKSVICADINYNCVAFINKMFAELKADNAKAFKANAFSFLKNHLGKYDLIFADPPFEMKGKEEIIKTVFKNNNLEEGGCLIIEHPPTDNFSKEEHFLECRRYNKVNFSIFGYASGK